MFESVITGCMANKKRYMDARVVDFPKGSSWQETWHDVRIIALERKVTLGVIVLEALRQYVKMHCGKNRKGKDV